MGWVCIFSFAWLYFQGWLKFLHRIHLCCSSLLTHICIPTRIASADRYIGHKDVSLITFSYMKVIVATFSPSIIRSKILIFSAIAKTRPTNTTIHARAGHDLTRGPGAPHAQMPILPTSRATGAPTPFSITTLTAQLPGASLHLSLFSGLHKVPAAGTVHMSGAKTAR
jgi:hypothetical protein